MADPRRRQRSPGEIAVMRDELEAGASLREVGRRHGVSGERVRQLVGPIGRTCNWRNEIQGRDNRTRLVKLLKAGLSYEEVAAEMGVTMTTIYKHLRQAGFPRRANPNKKHTQESAIWCAHEWAELFGYTPAATDWNPSQARACGQAERAERFEQFRIEFDAPRTGAVQGLFGSWSEFISQTGLQPAPYGMHARDYWKTGRPFGH